MSLNWNVEDCVGREDWSDRDHAVLDRLIWGTMTVGLHRITEANIPEWLLRMRMERAHYGSAFRMQYEGEEGHYLRLEHLRKFVGMRTNASDLTRAKWLKELMERVARSEADAFNRETKAMEKDLTKVGEA